MKFGLASNKYPLVTFTQPQETLFLTRKRKKRRKTWSLRAAVALYGQDRRIKGRRRKHSCQRVNRPAKFLGRGQPITQASSCDVTAACSVSVNIQITFMTRQYHHDFFFFLSELVLCLYVAPLEST